MVHTIVERVSIEDSNSCRLSIEDGDYHKGIATIVGKPNRMDAVRRNVLHYGIMTKRKTVQSSSMELSLSFCQYYSNYSTFLPCSLLLVYFDPYHHFQNGPPRKGRSG